MDIPDHILKDLEEVCLHAYLFAGDLRMEWHKYDIPLRDKEENDRKADAIEKSIDRVEKYFNIEN